MQAVALVDLPQHSGGYTGSDTVGWDVTRHHRAGGDDASRSDGHATAHRRTGAQPAVIPDGDGFGILQRMAAVGVICIGSFFGDKRMVGRGQRHIGSNEHIVPQRNGRYIQKYAVVVDETVPPHIDIHAVLAVKGCKRLEILPFCGGDQALQRTLLGLGTPQREAVEPVTAAHTHPVPLGNLRIGRRIETPRHHPLPFTARPALIHDQSLLYVRLYRYRYRAVSNANRFIGSTGSASSSNHSCWSR